MPDDAVRWTVTVSPETDSVVRAHLADRGLSERDLAEFVEEAVRWRVLDRTVSEVRGRFADMAKDDLDAPIEEAVATARSEGRKAG
jgi:Ribbon-helix-helix domain